MKILENGDQSLVVEQEGDTFILNIPDNLTPSVMRKLGLTPEEDAEIDNLGPSSGPIWRKLTVRALRFYRRVAPSSIRNRCVYAPSCSRYAELAFRKHGFFKAFGVSLRRLRRCNRKNGGIDLFEETKS